MCGIFFGFSSDPAVIRAIFAKRERILDTIRFRGPDKTAIVKDGNFVAIHTLLSMSGWYREQPIVKDDFLLLFNGEIYNDYERYADGYGDTDFLVAAVREKGLSCLKELDGEFAICLNLFESNLLALATDPFGTKPLYYQLGPSHCAVGTYEATAAAMSEALPVTQVPANTLVLIDLANLCVLETRRIREFDFSNQETGSFEKWNVAFGKAIRKRTAGTRQRCFVSLSSGHDSGLIAAELLEKRIPFHAYMAAYGEDKEVLERRLEILRQRGISCDVVQPSEDEYLSMQEFLMAHLDPYQLVNPDSPFENFPDPDMRRVPGYVVSAMIHKRAQCDDCRLSLSGQGGDEIYADYFNPYSNPAMSELKGRWDNVVRPWKNFYGGWNRVFLGGSERVAGMFGIETRYPFLDFDVVQEFLDLSPRLKADHYKAPITQRLRALGFPFHSRKFGFAGFATQV